jgi:hypothetical protein
LSGLGIRPLIFEKGRMFFDVEVYQNGWNHSARYIYSAERMFQIFTIHSHNGCPNNHYTGRSNCPGYPDQGSLANPFCYSHTYTHADTNT